VTANYSIRRLEIRGCLIWNKLGFFLSNFWTWKQSQLVQVRRETAIVDKALLDQISAGAAGTERTAGLRRRVPGALERYCAHAQATRICDAGA
jgi:hypothetical protein